MERRTWGSTAVRRGRSPVNALSKYWVSIGCLCWWKKQIEAKWSDLLKENCLIFNMPISPLPLVVWKVSPVRVSRACPSGWRGRSPGPWCLRACTQCRPVWSAHPCPITGTFQLSSLISFFARVIEVLCTYKMNRDPAENRSWTEGFIVERRCMHFNIPLSIW